MHQLIRDFICLIGIHDWFNVTTGRGEFRQCNNCDAVRWGHRN